MPSNPGREDIEHQASSRRRRQVRPAIDEGDIDIDQIWDAGQFSCRVTAVYLHEIFEPRLGHRLVRELRVLFARLDSDDPSAAVVADRGTKIEHRRTC